MNKVARPISIYLAGPIDGVSKAEARGWREQIDPPTNVVLFNPATCFVNGSKTVARPMHVIFQHVINCCDGVLVNLLGPGRGIGTMREIEFARMQSKPVAMACDVHVEAQSLMTYDVECYRSVDDAFTGLLSAILEGRNQPHPLAIIMGGMLPGMEDEDDG